MKRIAMITFSHYPADPRVRREAELLARTGFYVDIICLHGLDETETEKFGNVTAYRVMKGTEQKESFLKYLLLSVVFGGLAFFKLQKLSLRHGYDLIHVHNMPDFLVFVGLRHKLMGRPVILDLHDLTVELFKSKWGNDGLQFLQSFVQLGERMSCRFADHVITTSDGFRDKLIERKIDADKITLVLNSVDELIFKKIEHPKWQPIKSGLKLVYHGTVAKRFGLHVAIEAVALLKNVIPDITFHIYGNSDPGYNMELANRIKELDLTDHVFLKGYNPQEKIVAEMDNFDIAVVPYLSDHFMDLAVSTKTFEYAFMEVPIVASRLPSFTMLFDEKSINYFESGNAQQLANKILEFCTNPRMRKAFVKRSSKIYQKFAWSIMGDRYLKTINHLIEDNGK